MFDRLSFEEFCQLAHEHKRVAVFREFSSDLITPMTTIQVLSETKKNLILLESGEKAARIGRFSHVGFDPIAEIRSYGFESQVTRGNDSKVEQGDPFELLRRMHKEFSCGSRKQLLGMVGGAAGYIAYDAIRYVEDIPDRHADKRELPDFFFQFFDRGLSFDHHKGIVVIVCVVEVRENLENLYEQAMAEIDEIHRTITHVKPFKKREKKTFDLEKELKVTPEDEPFKKIVEKAKEYIFKGDVFQVVPSRRFQLNISASPFEIYRSMRMITPSPFMFFFQHPDFALSGASPEKLVSVHGKNLETIPLAGTRPRTKVPEEDQAAAEDLSTDPKECAEHMMLVDLGRNDLGKVSEPGSVYVEKLKEVQLFSHVMHLASFVKGTLREDCDALDALKATFPAGTLSGAPKIRAMEIIDELEVYRRGPYGGAIGVLDHQGNLDTCIGIRMAQLKDNVATIQAGMGVVMDSDPQKEADESRQKAKGILKAIQAAEEGEV